MFPLAINSIKCCHVINCVSFQFGNVYIASWVSKQDKCTFTVWITITLFSCLHCVSLKLHIERFFNWVSKVIQNWFCFTMFCDWFKKTCATYSTNQMLNQNQSWFTKPKPIMVLVKLVLRHSNENRSTSLIVTSISPTYLMYMVHRSWQILL